LGSRRKGIAPLLNYEELRDLINTLQAGLEAGFNTTTSPLIPALDALIDMNLAMAERFRPRRGIKLKPWQLIEPPIRMYHDLNPEIHDTFEEDIWQYGPSHDGPKTTKEWKVPDSDDLGNIRMIKTSFPNPEVKPDVRLVRYFQDQAQGLIKLKKIFEGSNIRLDLKKFFQKPSQSKQQANSGYHRRNS
jgi:hypothetical protein